MEMVIEAYDDSKLEAIVRLSLRAWEPVFESLREAMLPAVFQAFFQDDWRAAQRRAVESVCSDEKARVWVASVESQTARVTGPFALGRPVNAVGRWRFAPEIRYRSRLSR